MTDSEVLDYRDFKKNKILLCCETVSKNRFTVKQIVFRNAEVSIELSDGTKTEPSKLREIQGFAPDEIRQAQNYLLRQ